jgi:O-antigen/teichoic acid export membrane protein
MATGWSKDAGGRVLRGFLANALSQGGIILLQLLSVPIFFIYWGSAVYGSWLILFTLPSLLSFGDLGLSTSAGNDMIYAVASGRLSRAVGVFQSVLLAITCAGISVLIITVGIVAFIPSVLVPLGGHSSRDVAVIIVFLAAYSVALQYSGLFMAGFRSDGRYAFGSLLLFAISMVEYFVVMTIVVIGGKCIAVSAAFFVVRTLGCVSMSGILALRVPWLRQGFGDARMATLRGLAGKSLAAVALPIGYATTLQGTVLVLGSLLSPTLVSTFVTVRTATRMGVQGVSLLNHALMPEFAAVEARDDSIQRSQLVVANFFGIVITLAPIALVLIAFGPLLVGAWTRGHVVPDRSLVVGMVAVMIANGIWQPTSNLLLALNRQESYSYVYLALSLACLALSYVLISDFGIAGAVASNLLLDTMMLSLIFYLIFVPCRLGEIDLKAGFKRLTDTFRMRLRSSGLFRRQPRGKRA